MTNTLIVAGPNFRERAESDLATGNVDITPTLARLTGLDVPAGAFDGRVLEEALRAPRRQPGAGGVGGLVTGLTPTTGYSAAQEFVEVDGVRYFHSATATRKAPPPR